MVYIENNELNELQWTLCRNVSESSVSFSLVSQYLIAHTLLYFRQSYWAYQYQHQHHQLYSSPWFTIMPRHLSSLHQDRFTLFKCIHFDYTDTFGITEYDSTLLMAQVLRFEMVCLLLMSEVGFCDTFRPWP